MLGQARELRHLLPWRECPVPETTEMQCWLPDCCNGHWHAWMALSIQMRLRNSHHQQRNGWRKVIGRLPEQTERSPVACSGSSAAC